MLTRKVMVYVYKCIGEDGIEKEVEYFGKPAGRRDMNNWTSMKLVDNFEEEIKLPLSVAVEMSRRIKEDKEIKVEENN